MTSPSRKRRQTTPRSTAAPTPLSGGASRAAAAYAAVDRATRPTGATEPLWLPAGWLAVVLLLAAAAPSMGAPAPTTGPSDGWRARGPSRTGVTQPKATRSQSGANLWAKAPPKRVVSKRPIKQVAWHDDLAGPALRVAQRDNLNDAFEQPFGADTGRRPTEDFDLPPSDADTADSLFEDDLPPSARDLPGDDARSTDDIGNSLFDEPLGGDPGQEPSEEIAPGEPADEEPMVEEVAPPSDDDRNGWSKERMAAERECSNAMEELRNNRLASIDLSIGISGQEGEDFPYECRLNTGEVLAPRCWAEITYTWKASGLCHKPLYFEDVHLERYGHSWGPYVQPLVSGAHFFGRLPVLPYMMGLKTPNECVYTLGHYRPGDCAPYLIDPIPFTWRAALYQTGGVFGVAGILP